jgi:hypothetical protein
VASIGLVLILTRVAGAVCNVPQPRLLCAEYFKSQAVVIAKLIRVRHAIPKDEQDWFIYTLRTQRVFRGGTDSVFRVYEENSSARAGFDWRVGRPYLLFLDFDKTEKAWELDGCGNSGPVRRAAALLKVIETMLANPGDGGVIRGSVNLDRVLVVAYGKQNSFKAFSNNDGDFKISVPAGDYTVRAFLPGWSFSEADFSYENPEKIHIENGGCAQLQFGSIRKRGP